MRLYLVMMMFKYIVKKGHLLSFYQSDVVSHYSDCYFIKGKKVHHVYYLL